MDSMLGFKQFIVEMAIEDYSKSDLTPKHHEVALAEALRRFHNVGKISTYNQTRFNQIQNHPEFEKLVDSYKNKLEELHRGLGVKNEEGSISEIHWHDTPSHIKKTFGKNIPEHTRGADVSIKTSDGVHHHLDFKSSPRYSLRTAGEKLFSSIDAKIDRGSLSETANNIANSINKLKSPHKFVRELINGQKQDEKSGEHFSHKVVNVGTKLEVIRNDKLADKLLEGATIATSKGNSVSFGRVSLNVKKRTGKEERLNVAVRSKKKEREGLVDIYSGGDHIASWNEKSNTFYRP